MTSHRSSETTHIDTRARLIEQNKKLREQIVQLAAQVDEIIQKKGATAVKKQQPNTHEFDDKKKELRNQEHYISKLKAKITELKNSVMFGSESLVRKEEDKVTILKRELRVLEEERSTLEKLKSDKTKVLKDRDEPHGQLKGQLEEMKAAIRNENKQLAEKCMTLEKQIRKEHELSVNCKEATRENGKDSANYELLLPGLEAELRQAQQQKQSIEAKWNGKIEYLDTQMLQLRTIFESKKRRLDDLVREVKNWEIRKYVYRDEDSIKEVKERLAKLPIKPRSRTNTSKNSKATSMSMMENKPDQTQIIRRSTSKEKFRDLSPPAVFKEEQAPTKVIDKTLLMGKFSSKQMQEDPKDQKKHAKMPNDVKQMKLEQKKSVNQEQALSKKQIQQQTPAEKPKAQISSGLPSAPQISSASKQETKKLQPSLQLVKKSGRESTHNPLKSDRAAAPEHRNEFLDEVQSYPLSSIKEEKKQKKLLKSIAIGTSFYYHDD